MNLIKILKVNCYIPDMDYLNQFVKELNSRNGITSFFRKSSRCLYCGCHSKFGNFNFDSSKDKSENYVKQLIRKNINYSNKSFHAHAHAHEQDNGFISSISINQAQSIIDKCNISLYHNKIDVSLSKSHFLRIPNKSIIDVRIYCNKCVMILNHTKIYKENILEIFNRKLK